MRYSKIGKFVVATLKNKHSVSNETACFAVKLYLIYCYIRIISVLFSLIFYPYCFLNIYQSFVRIFIRISTVAGLFCIILAKRDADALYKHVDCKLHLVKGRNGRRDADVAVVVVNAVREG